MWSLPFRTCVLVTTPRATRQALQTASRIAVSGTRISVLVPYLVREGRTPELQPHVHQQVEDIARNLHVPIVVMACVCHEAEDILRQFVGRQGLLVIGGSDAQDARLAERLMTGGYHIVFSPVRASAA